MPALTHLVYSCCLLQLLGTVDLHEVCPDLPPAASVAAIVHVPDLAALFLALSSGELLLLHDHGAHGGSCPAGAAAVAWSPRMEEVGAVEGGLAAAEWSPGGEALALAGGAGQLLLMSADWELLGEVPLLSYRDDTPANAAASAAAAAQLRGLGGSGCDDGAEVCLAPGNVAITWRGDGKFFATVSRDAPTAAAATVRVWEPGTSTTGLELLSVGEAAPGLLPAGAWQPNGRHLYVAQLQQQQAGEAGADEAVPKAVAAGSDDQPAAAVRHVGAWKRELRRRAEAAAAAGEEVHAARVCLFERNGLQHGEFGLPTPADRPAAGAAEAAGPWGGGATLAQLAWSRDSELLAVVVAAVDAGGLPLALLQLWHRSNWHWYLKHERRLRWGPAQRGGTVPCGGPCAAAAREHTRARGDSSALLHRCRSPPHCSLLRSQRLCAAECGLGCGEPSAAACGHSRGGLPSPALWPRTRRLSAGHRRCRRRPPPAHHAAAPGLRAAAHGGSLCAPARSRRLPGAARWRRRRGDRHRAVRRPAGAAGECRGGPVGGGAGRTARAHPLERPWPATPAAAPAAPGVQWPGGGGRSAPASGRLAGPRSPAAGGSGARAHSASPGRRAQQSIGSRCQQRRRRRAG